MQGFLFMAAAQHLTDMVENIVTFVIIIARHGSNFLPRSGIECKREQCRNMYLDIKIIESQYPIFKVRGRCELQPQY